MHRQRSPLAPTVALLMLGSAVACSTPLASTSPLSPWPEERAAVARTASPDGGAGDESPDTEPAAEGVVASDEPAPAVGDDDARTGAPPAAASASAAPSAAPEAGATPWPGAYRGEDVSTYRLSGLPDRVERDPAARLTVRAQGDSALELIVVDSSNGNTICTLEATIAADRATIRPGQPCFEQQGEDTAVTASVTEGSATRSGGRLTLAATFALRLDFADTSLEGTLEYHFEGDRR